MSAAENKNKAFDFSILKRVIKYVRPYSKLFYMAALLTLVLGALSIVRPWLISFMIDNYIIADKAAEMLLKFTVIIIALIIIEGILQYYQTFISNKVAQSVTIDLRKDTFKKISHFKLSYFDKTPIGQLVTRVISDIETIADIFSEGIITISGDILKLIAVIIMMFYINYDLALFTLIPIPLLIIATRIFQKSVNKSFRQVRNQVAKLNSFVQEHVTGMSIVQVFNREEIEMQKFKEINREHSKAHIASVMAYSIFFPVVEILSALSIAFLVWRGVHLSLTATISFGELVSYILLVNMLYRPIRMLADRFNTLQMGMVGAERVFKILDTHEEIKDTGTINAQTIKGDIEFRNVSFAYQNENYVIKNISFHVKQGEKIAFVGATGSGKTSIINLLARFYEYGHGDIFIDGRKIEDYTLESIRKNIGVVTQDVFLFSDTILNNITLNNPDITYEQVVDAAKLVGAHDFIMQMPGNYHYQVRERGNTLSVGQRQLISFIRAYVYNPKILVLDEATSSVDTESEYLIQHAIEKLTENRTSIIIAHRLSTIQKADKIIVIDKGNIKESGSHEELLKINGSYKKLFELQFS
jgi:ATP-binding cassette subfamily B protein